MRGMDHCSKKDCFWLYRFELVGIILLVLGTLLTLFTLSSFGIGMLVLVGGVLCLHRNFGHSHCHSVDDLQCSEPTKVSKEAKVVVKTKKTPPVS